jgi:metallo-beta-lactamase family protein
MTMQLTFLGAAGEVTGSCYRIDTGAGMGTTSFLVDCGMFQGDREALTKNLAALDFDVSRLAFLLLTHAHIDHCGLLPRLVAKGFRGPIFCTPATHDLAAIMLMDSAHVQAKDAERALRHRERDREKGKVTGEAEETILYNSHDVERCMKQFRAIDYGVDFSPADGINARFRDAGHILGAASIEVWISQTGGVNRKIVFSGDIGERSRPILRDPDPPDSADVLLIESTYGDRDHKSLENTRAEFAQVIEDTLVKRHGNVIIPAFAVGRMQEVLYLIGQLVREGRIAGPKGGINVFVDSPLGRKATELTLKHHRILDDDVHAVFGAMLGTHGSSGKGRTPAVHFTESPEDSMAINRIESGAIIIAASGMCDAGRIRHHLRRRLNRDENTVVFTGYQAFGTLGRRIVDGAKTVRLFGEEIAVRARVETIGGLSAHAGQSGLLHWLSAFKTPPESVWLTHGEPRASTPFKAAIESRLHWSHVQAAGAGMTVSLEKRP